MDEDFNKKIATDFGLNGMGKEDQEKMIEKIGTLLFESVIERSVDLMDNNMMSEFEDTVTNAGSDYGQVISFLKLKVPGFQNIVSEEMSRLKRATSSIFT